MSVVHSTVGPKGLPSFVPRFFKNKISEKSALRTTGLQISLSETVLSGVDKRVVFRKADFGGCSPGASTFRCSPGTNTGTRVHSDVPPERKPEAGYVPMFPRNESRNGGTFAKTTFFYGTALLSPSDNGVKNTSAN